MAVIAACIVNATTAANVALADAVFVAVAFLVIVVSAATAWWDLD